MGKIGKFGIFRGNFPNLNLNQRWLTQPGSNFFDLNPSLIRDQVIFLLLRLGQISPLWVKKYPGQNRTASYLLQVKSRVGSGPISNMSDYLTLKGSQDLPYTNCLKLNPWLQNINFKNSNQVNKSENWKTAMHFNCQTIKCFISQWWHRLFLHDKTNFILLFT